MKCVITREQNFLLDVIDKIMDLQLRKEYLLKLKDSINREVEKTPDQEIYNLNIILERFNQTNQKIVTLQDLQR